MEVVIKSLIDFEVSYLSVGEHSEEPVVEGVSEDNQDKEDPEEDKKRHTWVGNITNACEDLSPSVTGGFDVTGLVDIVDVIIAEQLLVGNHPVTEGVHEEGSISQNSEDSVIQLVVISGWLSVTVIDHKFFNNIENKDLENS